MCNPFCIFSLEANVASQELQILRESVAQKETLVNQLQTLHRQLKNSEEKNSLLSSENRKYVHSIYSCFSF